jgi:ribosome-binding ATPase YchF (GTP1/OBG family)
VYTAVSAAANQALRKRAADEGCEVVVVSAKVESELNGMPAEEAKEWLEMLGVEPGEGGGLGALIRATYKTLGLQTYFTTGHCAAATCIAMLQLRLALHFIAQQCLNLLR